MSHTIVSRLTITVLLLLVSFSAGQVSKRSVKTCVLYFANVDDLGWTFSVNVGRLNMKTEIEKKYPNVILDTKSWANANFDYPTQEAKDGLWQELMNEKCEILISIGHQYFQDFYEVSDPTWWIARAKQYNNMTFMLLWDSPQAINQREADNLIFFIVDFTPGYYLAGVAAAAQATTCTGIMVPFDWNRNSHDAATGFAMGVRDTKPNMPVHIIPMNSFFAPWNELIVTDMLINTYGCEVISRYSDPRDVDVKVQSLRSRGIMSIGAHADLQQYVGDTVLTSVYAHWDKMFIPVVEDHINFGKIQAIRYPAVFGVASGHLTVSPISSAAKPDVQDIVNAARTAKLSANDNIMCGQPGLTTNWGANTNLTYKTGTNCRDLTSSLPGIGLTSNAVFHGAFEQPSNCPNGSAASYNTSLGTIKLQCDICKPDTFAVSGDRACTTCPNGLVASRNSSECKAKPVEQQQVVIDNSKDSSAIIWGITIPVVLLLLIAILIVARTRYIGWVKNKRAPKSGPLCLLFTDVEGSTNLWNQSPEAMSVAMDTHHAVIRKVIEDNQGYEVKTVGDAFMIAAPTALDGAIIAVEIQKALHTATWPAEFTASDVDSPWNGLKVRIGVNWCEEVEPKYEAVHNYWDYYGNDVNVSARIESKGQGGQITLSELTWNVILDDPAYDDLLGAAATVKSYARDVQLKGVEGGFSLYQMVPFALAGRDFSPLEGHEHDFTESGSVQTYSENASFASRDGVETLSNKSVNYIFQQMASGMDRETQRKVFGALAKEYSVPFTNPKNPRRSVAAIAVEVSKKIGVRVVGAGDAEHKKQLDVIALPNNGAAPENGVPISPRAEPVQHPNAVVTSSEEKYITPE